MKKFLSFLLAAVLMLSLCACGAGFAKTVTEEESWIEPYESSAVSAYSDSCSVGFGTMNMAADTEAVPMPAKAAGSSENSNGNRVSGTEDSASQESINAEKIIYSANTTIETTEYEIALEKIRNLIQEKKGFIESSSTNDSSYYNKSRGYKSCRSASYTIRIPSESFDEVMNTLATFGNVPYSFTYTENVTAQYYDTQARLDALIAQENRLIELLSAAESMEDILAIEDKLSEIRYNIDRHQSTLNNYDRKVAYSTICLELQEVAEYTPTVPVRRTFWEKLGNSMTDGMILAIEFLQNLILWLAENLPVLCILFVIFFGLYVLLKKLFRGLFSRIRRKHFKNRNKKENTEVNHQTD